MFVEVSFVPPARLAQESPATHFVASSNMLRQRCQTDELKDANRALHSNCQAESAYMCTFSRQAGMHLPNGSWPSPQTDGHPGLRILFLVGFSLEGVTLPHANLEVMILRCWPFGLLGAAFFPLAVSFNKNPAIRGECHSGRFFRVAPSSALHL